MKQNDSADSAYQSKLLDALQPLLNALVASVNSENSPEVVKLREMYLRRVVFAGDVVPSRLPPPQNITEVGGYINLLQDLQCNDMVVGAVASSCGMAAPLSANDRALLEHDLNSAIEKALSSEDTWIAACNSGHSLWKGNVNQTYAAAQKECVAHDSSVHAGKSTAVVLSL